jgi:hypothetical protein
MQYTGHEVTARRCTSLGQGTRRSGHKRPRIRIIEEPVGTIALLRPYPCHPQGRTATPSGTRTAVTWQ